MTNTKAAAATLSVTMREALFTLVREEGHAQFNHIVAFWHIGRVMGNALAKRGMVTKHTNDEPGGREGYRLTDDGMAAFLELAAYTPERHALLTRITLGFAGGLMLSRVGDDVDNPTYQWLLDRTAIDGTDADDLVLKSLASVPGFGGYGFASGNASLTVHGKFLLMLWNEQHGVIEL
jgi:hypothetical protein